MLPVTSAATTRTLDQTCIEALGVPGRQLMEVAGRAARPSPAHPNATVAVPVAEGTMVATATSARWLRHWGHSVRVGGAAPPEPQTLSPTPALPADGAHPRRPRRGPRWRRCRRGRAAGDRPARTGAGATGEALRALQGALPTVALDPPTGIHADTGQILDPCAVRAERTVTSAGSPVCSRRRARRTPGWRVGGHRARLRRSRRPSWPNPTRGSSRPPTCRGCPGMSPEAPSGTGGTWRSAGAWARACSPPSAPAPQARPVTVLAPRAEWPSLHGLPPHVILAEPSALDPRRHDVLVLGPGLGLDTRARDEALDLWDHYPRPIVGDADLLTHLAGRPAGDGQRSWGPDRLITPHSAEAARLLGWSRADVEADRFQAARVLGEGAVLKGPHTLLGGPQPWVNPTGSVRLATAGSGDVLAGLMGALLARGLSAREAAAAACWLHGEAGERLADNGTATALAAHIRLQPGG